MGKVYSQEGRRTRHGTRIVKLAPKKKVHCCPICSKPFYSKKNNLTRHIKEQHVEGVMMTKFKCDYCDYLSQYKKNIRQHCRDVHRIDQLALEFNTIDVPNTSERSIISE